MKKLSVFTEGMKACLRKTGQMNIRGKQLAFTRAGYKPRPYNGLQWF